jgi:hypothetical protein
MMGATMKTSGERIRRGLSLVAFVGVALGLGTRQSVAGASSRDVFTATTTSSSNGAVLIALGCGVLVLGGIGFVVFTWSRRKRVPSQCAEQREALELAERAVLYWEAARAHLEAVDRERRLVDNVASDNSTHASLVAKAVEGLHTAMKQRDDRQMELIHCMAGGIPGTPTATSAPIHRQPFFTPGIDGPPPSPTSTDR